MGLNPDTRLGPYEILAPLGAGGMGEVYRARDPRLGREVAIKVLPAAFSANSDRLRRFEQEARAAGLLNHPNILAIYDIGTHDGAPYIVSELLEGETLRERIKEGSLSTRKAIEYGVQMAYGLATAHEKGIVHRDLKPENIFTTKDGRVKILDFGLAKLTRPEESTTEQTSLPTTPSGTEAGIVMGTVGYMAPEQVRAKPTDARSDIFSFGVILYEMLSGQRAFHRESNVETMNAILKEEPPELAALGKSIPPGLERVVTHCLEKSPEQRFQSARDLAFALEALSGVSSSASGALPAIKAAHFRVPVKTTVVAGVAALLALALGYFVGQRAASRGPTQQPAYRRLTFRRGTVFAARFTPDGKTFAYSATWGGSPTELYTVRTEFPESLPIGISGANLLSISSSGEMAVVMGGQSLPHGFYRGTLGRAPLSGGTPREVLDDVEWADGPRMAPTSLWFTSSVASAGWNTPSARFCTRRRVG